MINAAESLKLFTPPVYIDRAGVTHTGKIFSAVEFETVKEQVLRAQAGQATIADIKTVLAEMFDAPTAEEIIGLPWDLYLEAITDFFGPRRAAPAPDSPAAAS